MRIRLFSSAVCLAFAIPSFAAVPAAPQTGAVAASPALDFSNFHFEQAIPWTSAGNGMTNDHWHRTSSSWVPTRCLM